MDQKHGKDKGRRRRATSLSEAGRPLLSAALRRHGFVQTEIVTRWRDIVGADMATATLPLRLVFPRGQRTGALLHIRTEAAFAPILQHREEAIVAAVNRYFGYGAVRGISIRHGPLPRRAGAQKVEDPPLSAEADTRLQALLGGADSVKDNPVRQALRRLGEAVYRREKA
ncbi:DUF721 domain-containing protein [Yunchengibacter salinarum]|uniref:DUF721 domain-containing protein n=1 Tax=Yunchengibacter salinarum TaxID=3133399 RepID=UPI0035B6286B